MLISLFERCMKRRGVKESDPYDWEKAPAGDNVTNTTTSNTTGVAQAAHPPTAPSTLQRYHTHRHTMATDNNQENIEPTDNKDAQLLEARRKRLETENTAPLATDTAPMNVTRQVDKNCNATLDQAAQQGERFLPFSAKVSLCYSTLASSSVDPARLSAHYRTRCVVGSSPPPASYVTPRAGAGETGQRADDGRLREIHIRRQRQAGTA